MKFVAISNFGSFIGGGEHSFVELISRLNDHWSPVVIVPEDSAVATILRERNISTHIVPIPPLRPQYSVAIVNSFKKIFMMQKKYEASFIYTNGSRSTLYGAAVGKLVGKPVIWHCRVAENDPLLDIVLFWLCDYIIVNSLATARRFEKYHRSAEKLRVIYNGLDIEWLTDRKASKPSIVRDNDKSIIMVARISKWKRHDIAISVFEELARAIPEVHMFFIGAMDADEPEWFEQIHYRSAVSPFSDRMHWIGYADDVRPWYQAAYLSILTSDNEPFGRVVVESMACGVPVVANRSGGIPEIIEHEKNGLLVESGNIDQFVAAIKMLLTDDKLRDVLGRNAVKRAQSFSIQQHIESMEKVFKRVS